MTQEELKNFWEVSEYNESTADQLDYYINKRKCKIGDDAYIYSHEEDKLYRMEIVHIISRMTTPKLYDILIQNDDVLINGEETYKADTSAEFITDNDCYLVWFKYC